MEEETWKEVFGFPAYEASTLGSVRSLPTVVNVRHHGYVGTRVRPGKMLKLIPNRGYLVVKLGKNGKITTLGVHQVVALAFHGECPKGYVVDHIDTDKLNNCPANLEYVTNTENVKRQYKTGLLTNKAGQIGRWKHLERREI